MPHGRAGVVPGLVLAAAWLALLTVLGFAASFRGLLPLDARSGEAVADARLEMPLWTSAIEPVLAPFQIVVGASNYQAAAKSTACWIFAGVLAGFLVAYRRRSKSYRGWRLFLSRSGNLGARWLLRLPITEYTTSLRAARLDRVPAGLTEDVPHEGYAFFLTSAVQFVRQGLRIAEIPIHFHDRKDGVSKIARIEIIRCMINLVRLAFQRDGTKR